MAPTPTAAFLAYRLGGSGLLQSSLSLRNKEVDQLLEHPALDARVPVGHLLHDPSLWLVGPQAPDLVILVEFEDRHDRAFVANAFGVLLDHALHDGDIALHEGADA